MQVEEMSENIHAAIMGMLDGCCYHEGASREAMPCASQFDEIPGTIACTATLASASHWQANQSGIAHSMAQ